LDKYGRCLVKGQPKLISAYALASRILPAQQHHHSCCRLRCFGYLQVVTAWNGQAISAYTLASCILQAEQPPPLMLPLALFWLTAGGDSMERSSYQCICAGLAHLASRAATTTHVAACAVLINCRW
jgi:hypothetical protein